jgi:hypothetical protein
MKKIKYIISFLFILLIQFSFLSVVNADNSLMSGVSEPCMSAGDCSLNDVMQVGVQLFKIILGLVGSLSLLMFVYGGFYFILSQGDSGKVTKAKDIIKNAIIGLIIVFASYTIVNFTLLAIGYTGKWSGE